MLAPGFPMVIRGVTSGGDGARENSLTPTATLLDPKSSNGTQRLPAWPVPLPRVLKPRVVRRWGASSLAQRRPEEGLVG